MKTSRKDHRIFQSDMHHNQAHLLKLTRKESLETIVIPYSRIQAQLEIYSWRKRQCNQVASYNWVRLEPGGHLSATLYLQPPYINTINDSKAISIISKIFMGFQCLYEKFGPFLVCQEMIAFDIFLNPFVWLNKEFIKNQYIRDHISEAEFSSNILYILLKNDHKFQGHSLLDCCSGLKSQQLSLKQLSHHFRQLYEKRSSVKRCKSPESTLSFNKKSKKKQMTNFKNKIRSLGRQSNLIYHSYLNLDQMPQKIILQQSPSLKNIDFSIRRKDDNLRQSQNKLRTSLSRSSSTDKQETEGCLSLPRQDVLDVSLFFETQDHIEPTKQVLQLQKLDRLKRLLVTSINMND